MVNKIFFFLLILLFILLGYFGIRQMQYTQKLQAQLDLQSNQIEKFKKANSELEGTESALKKSAEEVKLTNQNLNQKLSTAQTEMLQCKKKQSDLMLAHSQLQTKFSDVTQNYEKCRLEKNNLSAKFYKENQALTSKIQSLTQRLQTLEKRSEKESLNLSP